MCLGKIDLKKKPHHHAVTLCPLLASYMWHLSILPSSFCILESCILLCLKNRIRELLFLPLQGGTSEKIISCPNPENLETSQIMWQDECRICLIFCHLLSYLPHNLNFCQFSDDSEFDITVFAEVAASLKNKRKMILKVLVYIKQCLEKFCFSKNLFPSSAVIKW